MNRCINGFAVVAAVGAAALAGGSALDALISPAAAQQTDDIEQERAREEALGEETLPGEEDRAESQIARAAGAGPAMQVTELTTERSEHGRHIADQDGRALYLLESESDGESTCYDRCAEQWPPALTAEGSMADTQGRRIDENLVGSTDRRDGGAQLTYGDYPLYYYYRDEQQGDVTGHDVHDEWGGWYLVSPEGEPVEESGDDEGGDESG